MCTTRLLIRWLCSCLILFAIACKKKNNQINTRNNVADSLTFEANVKKTMVELKALKRVIKSGDVITRTGNDFTSQSLRKLNTRDDTFSHAGIASIENDSLFVYHAIGGEYNPNQTIKRDLFEYFSTPYENNALGIYRIDVKTNICKKIIQEAKAHFGNKLLFDLAFDLTTDDKMYCSEFVYKCFLKGSDGIVKFHHSFIKDFEFIGVDDITMDSLSNKIVVYQYRLY
jgi:Permuted papain-like amidase enzyme, YaeF/YiiX, C92 family